MNVGQISSRSLVSRPVGTTLSEIAKLMHDRHVGAVVITKAPLDRPVAVGIITDRDIVRAQLARGADLTSLPVEEFMTGNPLVLNEEDSVEDAIRRMQARGVRRAPVVTSGGMLAGLVSTDDLIAQVARELVGLAQGLWQQPRKEGT